MPRCLDLGRACRTSFSAGPAPGIDGPVAGKAGVITWQWLGVMGGGHWEPLGRLAAGIAVGVITLALAIGYWALLGMHTGGMRHGGGGGGGYGY
jgi:hypothetical protein